MFEVLDNSLSLPTWALLLHGAVTLVLILALWSIKYDHKADYRIDTDKPAIELISSVVGLTHGHLIGGNAVEILENGVYFDSLLEDVLSAKSSIHFETFLWKDGKIGRQLGEAFASRAEAGIDVRVLADANGCRHIGIKTSGRLEDCPAVFAWFRPRKLRHFARLNTRDHRKIAIIDGRIAYVGGHCVVDSWLGDAEDREHFRDVSLRLRGPIVQQLQSVFAENWVATTGELFVGNRVFPNLEPEGNVSAHIVRLHLNDLTSDVKVLHHLMINCAQEQIRIQNPYFIPDPIAIELLIAAVNRGVDVRVMAPSVAVSDMPTVQRAAHRNFMQLLRGGVQIYEYEKTLLHQKVMTIDGNWAGVGSTNFDDRSFEINKEVTVGLCDRGVVARLDAIFEKDLAHCRKLEAEEWARRGLRRRVIENVLYLFNEQI